MTQKRLILFITLFALQLSVSCNWTNIPLESNNQEPVENSQEATQLHIDSPVLLSHKSTSIGAVATTPTPSSDGLYAPEKPIDFQEQEAAIPITPSILPATLIADTNPHNLAQAVHQSETVRLVANIQNPEQPESFADLDTGYIDDNPESDVQFLISGGGGGMYFAMLKPVNNSEAKPMGMIGPGLKGCNNNSFSFTSGGIPELKVGSYICLKSSQNNIVQLRVEDINIVEGWIEISFITESIP